MKKIFIIAVISVFAATAFSQSGYTSLQYSIGFGTGDMKDFIGQTSFRGFTIDYRHMSRSNLGIGVDIGWNVFYQEMPDAVYQYKDITYSGKQWRYSNQFPILFAMDYFHETGGNFTPYAGLGLGTMYSLQNTDMSVYTFEKDAWHFALRPELGILINASPGLDFTIAAKYYYGFKAGDLPAQGYFALNLGFVFMQ